MRIEFIPSNNLGKGKNVLRGTNVFNKNFEIFLNDFFT